jgi:hypothetical protein
MRVSTELPKSHVPVVVCRLVGIRTRGRLTTLQKKPAAGGEPANSVSAEDRDLKQRRTGLFRLCRPSKGRLTEEACLSCRACGRDKTPFQTMAVQMTVMRVMRISVSIGPPTAHHRIAVARRSAASILRIADLRRSSRLQRARAKDVCCPPKPVSWRGFARALRWGMPR